MRREWFRGNALKCFKRLKKWITIKSNITFKSSQNYQKQIKTHLSTGVYVVVEEEQIMGLWTSYDSRWFGKLLVAVESDRFQASTRRARLKIWEMFCFLRNFHRALCFFLNQTNHWTIFQRHQLTQVDFPKRCKWRSSSYKRKSTNIHKTIVWYHYDNILRCIRAYFILHGPIIPARSFHIKPLKRILFWK